MSVFCVRIQRDPTVNLSVVVNTTCTIFEGPKSSERKRFMQSSVKGSRMQYKFFDIFVISHKA